MALALLRPGAQTFVEQATVRTHDGFAFEDVLVGPGLTGRLVDLQLRKRYGVLVVAVRKASDGNVHGPPDSEMDLEVGDMLVVVGQPDALARFSEEMSGSR